MKLDHVAIAAHDATELLDYLVGTLGGVVIFGDQGIGFRPMQVRVGDGERGMTIELLEPWRSAENDFLTRFLDRNGAGPHHLTFKVVDFDDALTRVHDAGFTPVAVDSSNPSWKEMFLHPGDATGTVIQLAESHDGFEGPGDRLEHLERHGPDELMDQWWPDPPAQAPKPAWVLRVVVGGPDLGALEDLYAGLLQGTEVARTHCAVDLTWPHGAHVLLEATDDGSQGIRRIEFAQPDAGCPGDDSFSDNSFSDNSFGDNGEVVVAGARFVRVSPDCDA